MYIAGGLSSINNYLYSKDIECWRRESGRWYHIATTPTTRIGAKLQVDDRRLYIVGGVAQPENEGGANEIEAVQMV